MCHIIVPLVFHIYAKCNATKRKDGETNYCNHDTEGQNLCNVFEEFTSVQVVTGGENNWRQADEEEDCVIECDQR